MPVDSDGVVPIGNGWSDLNRAGEIRDRGRVNRGACRKDRRQSAGGKRQSRKIGTGGRRREGEATPKF